MINSRLINTKVAGGGGCTDIVDNYDPFDGNGVALYQLNGNADDVSENYDGADSDVTWGGAGVFGTSAAFNGSTSVIDTSITSLTDSYTFSLWFKPTVAPSPWGAISACREPNVYTACFIYYPNGNLAFSSASGGNFIETSGLSINNWYHAVGVKDGTTQHLYINGQMVASGSTTTSVAITDQVRLGKYDNETTLSFTGEIDQVRIFDTALEPLEVEALYTEELCICDGTVDTLQVLGGGDTSCIAAYQLNGNANDLSGNYSGTPTDVSYGVGEFDLAGVFNGSSSFVDTNFTVPAISTYSASLWFKTTSTLRQYLFSDYDSAGADSTTRLTISINSGNFVVVLGNGSTSWINSSVDASSYLDGNWHNLIYTIDGSSVKLYADGNTTPIGNLTSSFSAGAAGTQTLKIGTSGFLEYYFNGSIDQVRIFNKALDQDDVAILFAESACAKAACTGTTHTLNILGGGDTSCIAAYPLDGSPADLSGNYNAITGGVTYPQGYFDLAAQFSIPAGFETELLSANQDYTFSAFVNVSPISSPDYQFIFTFDSGFGSSSARIGIINGNWGINCRNINELNGGAATYNQWVHLVGTYDTSASRWELIVNGTSLGTSVSAIPTGLKFRMGRNTSDTVPPNGRVDQLRIFNKVLNSSEITTLANETPCN